MSDTDTRPLLATLYDPDIDQCARCERGEDGCVCGRLPYVELFAWNKTTQLYDWLCNVCGTVVGLRDRVHCPEHVPGEIPGLVMAECFREDGDQHPRVWYPDSDNGYGHPCPFCMLAQAREAHEGCEHARHRAWQSWKPAHHVLQVLDRMGLCSWVSYRSGGGCDGCVTVRWRWAR